MGRTATPTDRVVEAIAQHSGCGLDEVVAFCPELSWNQIFLEVDRLSRDGVLKLALVGPGRYTVTLPTERKRRFPQSKKAPLPMRPRQDTQCERCGGLMVVEECDNFNGWRCILCGERVDPVILAQRQKFALSCLQTVHACR